MNNYRILIARFDGSAPYELCVGANTPIGAVRLVAIGPGEVKALCKDGRSNGYYRVGKAVARVLEVKA